MTRMTNTTSIIDRLLKLADSKGITQKQLAKSIGVNPQTHHKLESPIGRESNINPGR